MKIGYDPDFNGPKVWLYRGLNNVRAWAVSPRHWAKITGGNKGYSGSGFYWASRIDQINIDPPPGYRKTGDDAWDPAVPLAVNPVSVRRLASGKYRVRTPGGIKSYGTTLARAKAQARLLQQADNPNLVAYHRRRRMEEREIDQEESLPPTYQLVSLEFADGLIKPLFPVQILPNDGSMVEFRFWGSHNYDIHDAFRDADRWVAKPIVRITYNIWVGHVVRSLIADPHRFEHKFRQIVKLSRRGMMSQSAIMRAFRDLEGLPRLPNDWTYFQFIN